ncbi:uncharacterized protein LOC125034448 [Penaeus chinensis]|uniref:uncharacterized protein LOC125034448 n=1 Tax=Penaeus chinensis TaxID=139456 RepID=UPI001FB6136F|nr:uncharacterized protein LOC125034448 [Penaeus chinensis]
MVMFSRGEELWLGGDLNGHVGSGNIGAEEVMGRHGYGERNDQGDKILSIVGMFGLVVANTYFSKPEAEKVTYSSGGRKSQIDYIMTRRRSLETLRDCKVFPGEAVTNQHRPVVCKMIIQADGTPQYHGMKKIKWWRLKELPYREDFVTKVKERISGKETTWEKLSENMRSVATVVLGKTSGKAPKAGKDTWWWNEEVQQAIAEERNRKRMRDQSQSDEAAQQYKAACSRAKTEVAKVKSKAYQDLYKKLDSTEGQ